MGKGKISRPSRKRSWSSCKDIVHRNNNRNNNLNIHWYNSQCNFMYDIFIEFLKREHFEFYAKQWMEQTLIKLKSFRPLAKWGYYRFPDCHDNEKSPKCSPRAQVWKMNSSIPHEQRYNFFTCRNLVFLGLGRWDPMALERIDGNFSV